eukprot:4113584-Lingulodinium_polyedra.AAC.1
MRASARGVGAAFACGTVSRASRPRGACRRGGSAARGREIATRSGGPHDRASVWQGRLVPGH